MTSYDKEIIYDEQISPLVEQIIQICKKNQIPTLMTFQYKYDDVQGADLCTTRLRFQDVPEIDNLEFAYKAIHGLRSDKNIVRRPIS